MKKLSFYLIVSILFVSCLSKQNEKTVSLEAQEIKISKLPFNISPRKGQSQKKTRSFSPNRILSNINTPKGCPDIWGTHRCVAWIDREGKMADDNEYWHEIIVSPTQDLRGYMFEFQSGDSAQHPRDKDAHVRRADTSNLQVLLFDSSWNWENNKIELIPDSTPNETYKDGSTSTRKAKCINGNLVTLSSNSNHNNVYGLSIAYPSSTSKGDFRMHTFLYKEEKEYSKKLSKTLWENFDQQTDFLASPQKMQGQNILQCFKL